MNEGVRQTSEEKIQVHDITWAVHREGDGPPLLMLHGFTGSHRSFDDIVPYLVSHWTVIRVDLPGHGETEMVEQRDCTMREAVDSLEGLMQSLGYLEYGVVGYSFGGRVALSLACEHPTHVTLLALESASPGIEDEVERTNRRLADRKLAHHVETVPLGQFIDEWSRIPLFDSQHRLSAEQRQKQDAIRRAQRRKGLAASLRGMGTGEQPSYWNSLANLRIPVCLMVGEEDEKFQRIANVMAEQIPLSEVHVIPCAGHTVHLEQPVQYRRTLVTFLQRVWRR